MKQSILLSVGSAAVAAAHGIVSDLKIGSAFYGGYNPYQDKYMNPVPERIVWAFPDAGNGPVEDVTSSAITCNLGATAAPISATANAGDEVTFYWTEWPESHKGPVMTYMASCGGDCSSADATSLSFFKIDHAGYDAAADSWASDDLIAANNSWTVTIPSDIASGGYLIRHEILALHSAGNLNGAQFYPMCANLEVTGSGSASPEGVNFPGAYSAEDPGIHVSIYSGLTSYTIPGPDVYGSSGSSGSVRQSSVAVVEPATSVAAEIPAASPVTEASSVAVADPAVTSVAAEVPEVVIPTAVIEEPAATSVAVEEPEIEIPTAVVEEPAVTSAVEAPAVTSAVEVPAVTSVEIPTFSSAPDAGIEIPTVAAPATTLATVTRPTEAAPTADAGSGSSSVSINQCLDKVNECIRNAQSTTGGAVDFSACEAERANCQ